MAIALRSAFASAALMSAVLTSFGANGQLRSTTDSAPTWPASSIASSVVTGSPYPSVA